MFDALADDESEDEETDNDEGGSAKNENRAGEEHGESNIPAYEDLSMTKMDEGMVLQAVYGDDFHQEEGPWKSRLFCVNVRPPDIDAHKIGSQLM